MDQIVSAVTISLVNSPSPNPNMQIDSHTRGFNFFRRTLDGISNRMYGTKKITKAMLYLLSLRRSSSCERPKTFAFAMLTLVLSARSA
jgi:hypothetical protein